MEETLLIGISIKDSDAIVLVNSAFDDRLLGCAFAGLTKILQERYPKVLKEATRILEEDSND